MNLETRLARVLGRKTKDFDGGLWWCLSEKPLHWQRITIDYTIIEPCLKEIERRGWSVEISISPRNVIAVVYYPDRTDFPCDGFNLPEVLAEALCNAAGASE